MTTPTISPVLARNALGRMLVARSAVRDLLRLRRDLRADLLRPGERADPEAQREELALARRALSTAFPAVRDYFDGRGGLVHPLCGDVMSAYDFGVVEARVAVGAELDEDLERARLAFLVAALQVACAWRAEPSEAAKLRAAPLLAAAEALGRAAAEHHAIDDTCCRDIGAGVRYLARRAEQLAQARTEALRVLASPSLLLELGDDALGPISRLLASSIETAGEIALTTLWLSAQAMARLLPDPDDGVPLVENLRQDAFVELPPRGTS
jgi:hypothetical protein